ncbi:ECD.2 family protein [Megaselia abdita]
MTSKPCNLEFVREDDFVEYFLFPVTKTESDQEIIAELEKTLFEVNKLLERFQKDYIWHKDVIKLTARTNSSEILFDDDTEKRVTLPPHLYGISHYGENIQDEWFIVHLLNEVTKEIPDLICKIVDSDGEFLLIEASDHLPSWATPETCENRVFLVKGHMNLVQNSPSNDSGDLPVDQSLEKIRKNPSLYKVSKEIQKCIDDRLEKLLEEIEASFHNQIVKVPLSIGCILEDHPDLIAPVVRTFCERDPIDLKVMRAMKFFPPEEERVRTSVKFTRCLYAMFQSSKYLPEKKSGWNLPANMNSEPFKEALLGVKLACGFEILAAQGKELGDNLEEDRNWKTYLKSLTGKGYFNENLEGSAEYNRLLNEAIKFYKENESRFRTTNQVGRTIVKYLKEKINDTTKQELRNNERDLRASDSDDWMNITEEELNTLLASKYGTQNLVSANGAINSKEFTENINEFLEKKSEFDGVDDDDEEDQSNRSKLKKNASMRKAVAKENSLTEKKDSNINFDPDSFSTHIRNLLDFVIPEDKWESNSELSEFSDDENLVNKMSDMTTGGDLKSYMKQMDQELAQTTIGKSFEKKDTKDSSDDDFGDIESFKPIDIDANTVKNMMDSYKSQMGAAGPTSTLLNSMRVGTSSSVIDEDLSETTV